MKRVLAIILEIILFLFAFFVGSILPVFPSFHVPLWSVDISATRYFVLDGVFLMLALYVLFLIFGAFRRRLISAAFTSTVAIVIAFILGLLMKFGFATR
ncbi:MAG TPA: hypothetical protein VIJ65_10615 [Acidobacteriaceae bacterium]